MVILTGVSDSRSSSPRRCYGRSLLGPDIRTRCRASSGSVSLRNITRARSPRNLPARILAPVQSGTPLARCPCCRTGGPTAHAFCRSILKFTFWPQVRTDQRTTQIRLSTTVSTSTSSCLAGQLGRLGATPAAAGTTRSTLCGFRPTGSDRRLMDVTLTTIMVSRITATHAAAIRSNGPSRPPSDSRRYLWPKGSGLSGRRRPAPDLATASSAELGPTSEPSRGRPQRPSGRAAVRLGVEAARYRVRSRR